MKGIILSGGKGTRLLPFTLVMHKNLLPVYNKPMIYYPLKVLIDVGINEILIITTKEYLESYKKIINEFKIKNLTIEYICEPESKGTAQAIILAKSFIEDDDVCLIYGDNLFLGNISKEVNSAIDSLNLNRASLFAYKVEKKSAKKYGVIEINKKKDVISIEEKPKKPKSKYISTGLYIFPNDVVRMVKKIELSPRGELEITDINKLYLKSGRLKVIKLNKKIRWIDIGNAENLLKASNLAKKYAGRKK